jgi:glycosyltransferase involved in cell wall biosynthesis
MHCPDLNDLPPAPLGKSGWPWTEQSASAPLAEMKLPRYPRVTVVTPSYNQAEFLEETIRSVLLQGYPNLEYIVIDGGSTDGSVDVIEKYSSHIDYWISERDDGQASAINRGWMRASGEVIAYLNSDDLLLPGAVHAVVGKLLEEPAVDLLYGTALWMDRGGSSFHSWPVTHFDACALLMMNFIAQPAVFFRSRVFDRIGYLNERLHYSLDYEYFIRLSQVGVLQALERQLAIVRVHSSAKTSHGDENFFIEELLLFEELLEQGAAALPRECIRRALISRLVHGAGLHNGFSPEARIQFLNGLRRLNPAPVTRELANAILWRDELHRSLFPPATDASKGWNADRSMYDVSGSLSSLSDQAIIDDRQRASIARTVRKAAWIREARIVRATSSYFPLAAGLLRAAAEEIAIIAVARWWIYLLVPRSADRVAKPLYRAGAKCVSAPTAGLKAFLNW